MKLLFYVLAFVSFFYWFFTGGAIDGITILPIFPLLMLLNESKWDEWAREELKKREQ